jgi:hypothetical protein
MLCANCNKANTFEDFEFCKPCFDTVMLLSTVVQHNKPELPLEPVQKHEEKCELDCKEDLGHEEIIEHIRNAQNAAEYNYYFIQLNGFIGETDPIGNIYICPLCNSHIEIVEENCKVFRCAVIQDGYVNPHAGLSDLIELKKSGIIIGGCLAPLDLNNSNGLFIPVRKDGSPFYY